MFGVRVAFAVLWMTACPPARLPAQQPHPGKAVYERWCAGCHGDDGAGDGEGAAHMLPRPRDFTRGIYQIRSTASGELPTDADLRRAVDDGLPGTAMPGWRSRLTERERADVIAYLKTFSADFEGAQPQAIASGRAPAAGAEALADGAKVYEKLECFKCHGRAGRGDGASAPTLTDDWDQPIRAADLTKSWNFNGGASVEQIYLRMRTGLDGTPMPSFSDAVEGGIVSDEQLWHLAQWVRSLSPELPPRVREVIRAARVDGPLPVGPADTAWRRAEAFYVPLVGQIIRKPRWFIPSVDAIEVQAMHDGTRLAIRLAWHDPSRSPAPAWEEWLGRVRAALPAEGGDSADSAALRQGPDLVTMQLPLRPAGDAERPYFLGGDRRRPAYLVRWRSTPDSVEVGAATGLGTFRRLPPAAPVTHTARYEAGEWQLQLTRPLASTDSAAAPGFVPGRSVPVAFAVADGSNGEDAERSAVSAWYAIYLDVPTPTRVYVQPILAALMTAGIGFTVVLRAQRRARAGGTNREES